MKKFLSLLSLLMSLVLIDACQKPDELINSGLDAPARTATKSTNLFVDKSVTGDYEVRNGMLYFRSFETYSVLNQELQKSAPEKRAQFTDKIGFKSLLSIELEVFNTLSEVDNAESFKLILESNKDIIKQENGKINLLFEDALATLLNREGMVSIGGKIHCFPKGKAIIADGPTEVRESYLAGKKVKSSTVFLVTAQNSDTGARRSAGPCSAMSQSAYSPDNKRRVDVSVIIDRTYFVTSSDQYGNFVTVQFYTYVRGDPYKTNFFGNWTSYSTSNLLYSRYYTYIKVWFEVGHRPDYQVINTEINDTRGNDSSTFIDYTQVLASYDNVRENSVTNGTAYYYDKSVSPVPAFSGNTGKYSSGGVPDGVLMTCP